MFCLTAVTIQSRFTTQCQAWGSSVEFDRLLLLTLADLAARDVKSSLAVPHISRSGQVVKRVGFRAAGAGSTSLQLEPFFRLSGHVSSFIYTNYTN